MQELGEVPVHPTDDLVRPHEEVRVALGRGQRLCGCGRVADGTSLRGVAFVLGDGELVRRGSRSAEVLRRGGARTSSVAAGGESCRRKRRKEKGDLHLGLPPDSVRHHDTRAAKRVKEQGCR